MTRSTHPDETPSLSLAEQIDRICDDFEARWRAGKQPRPEEFLTGAGPERPRLLLELLRLELEYRRKAGETPDREEYGGRFPTEVEVLDDLFGAACTVERLNRTAPYLPGRASDHLPVVPGYEVLSVLGRGGMGIVYRARQVRLGREVALKTVRSPLVGEALRQRFEAEARAVARLDHPHLVRVFDSGEADGRPWFALELVEGGTLARALR